MATSSRSRSSSVNNDGGPSFVNFSTPGRTMSMKSDASATWREQVEAALTGKQEEERNEEREEVLPYRPVKTNFVQLHVTSSSVPPSRPSLENNARPSLANTSRPPSRDASRPPSRDVARPSLDASRPSLNFSRPRSASAASQRGQDVVRQRPNINASLQDLAISRFSDDEPRPPSRRFSFSRTRPATPRVWPNNVAPPPPSPGGNFRFHSTPTLTKTPWENDRGKTRSRWSRQTNSISKVSARIFRELPREIYQCILNHVENVHTRDGLLDVPASRADLRALCLVDSRWYSIAKEHLYRELWLPSSKPGAKRKFLRQPKKSKLKLLANTLRNASETAFLVYDMRITSALAGEIEEEASGTIHRESVLATLQDMIQQCYNLERLGGYIPQTAIATFPLFQALSTRTRLATQAWYLDSSRKLPSLGTFMNWHDQWKHLETLVIAADPNVDLGKIAVSAVLSRLPKLKNLMLAGLHDEDFHNGSLVALPVLESLRLERLGGVTEQGVQQLAYSRLAPRLKRLSLVGLELKKLETVQTLLLHLTRLKALVVVQDASPELQVGPPHTKKFNLLMSASLEYLHWDCLALGSAISRFAEAIQTGKFLQLRKVKIPCDFDGSIQTLCRPIKQVQLTQKDMNYLNANFRDSYERNLLVSQIQAQIRIRKYRRTPSYRFAEQSDLDENGLPHDIGSCLGNEKSRIEYSLEPDVDAAALAGFGEVARPRRGRDERLESEIEIEKLF